MYRYSVDQSIIYTSEDIVLYRESPFACWMERLSLENPAHGIPPDVGSASLSDVLQPQNELAATLQDEGKDVLLIEWESDEPNRRTATLAGMRHGVDFIINGQLAVGPLAGSANLLMRTSGYSELGNYLYVPCDTQLKTTLSSAFRLCFLADLLHSLQGQLPSQMLILRTNSDVIPLQSEDHIYHYRAVKQRFMSAQRDFKKHRMPDPVESSHFGRWSDCANEVLKQRALGKEESPLLDQPEAGREKVAVSAGNSSSPYDLDQMGGTNRGQNSRNSAVTSGTLAEQARMLDVQPSAYSSPGDHLQQLEFIGSSTIRPAVARVDEPVIAKQFAPPPPASLRNPTRVDFDINPDPGESEAMDKPLPAPFSNNLITNADTDVI